MRGALSPRPVSDGQKRVAIAAGGAGSLVVWEDWIASNGAPAIKGTRVRNDGVVLDPTWPALRPVRLHSS